MSRFASVMLEDDILLEHFLLPSSSTICFYPTQLTRLIYLVLSIQINDVESLKGLLLKSSL